MPELLYQLGLKLRGGGGGGGGLYANVHSLSGLSFQGGGSLCQLVRATAVSM